MEKYCELEMYEIGRMEMALEILKENKNVFFPPPVTEKEIDECYDDLKAFAMLHPLPKDLINFLKRHNGFKWNSIEIFGADKIYEIGNSFDQKLMDIFSINRKLFKGNSVLNKLNTKEKTLEYLCFGNSAENYFVYNEKNDTWEIHSMTIGETLRTYDSFPAFFASEIGCVIGKNE